MGKIIHGIFDSVPQNAFKTTAIIAAAGTGSRMGLDINKLFLTIEDKPVLAYTLDAFEECSLIDEIIIVANKNDIEIVEDIKDAFMFQKVKSIVVGGSTRQESVLNGLKAVSEDTKIVAIHDGARPFISPSIICDCVYEAEKHGACAVGIPAKDSIKKIDEKNLIVNRIERENIVMAQTPQCFQKDLILRLHQKAVEDNFQGTDDCSIAEKYGVDVYITEGNSLNFKLTTPDDFYLASALVAYRGDLECE